MGVLDGGHCQFDVKPGNVAQFGQFRAQIRIERSQRLGQVVVRAQTLRIRHFQQRQHAFGTQVDAIGTGPHGLEAALGVEIQYRLEMVGVDTDHRATAGGKGIEDRRVERDGRPFGLQFGVAQRDKGVWLIDRRNVCRFGFNHDFFGGAVTAPGKNTPETSAIVRTGVPVAVDFTIEKVVEQVSGMRLLNGIRYGKSNNSRCQCGA